MPMGCIVEKFTMQPIYIEGVSTSTVKLIRRISAEAL